MTDLNSFMEIPHSKKTDQKQPRNILKSRTKRTVNREAERNIKVISSSPPPSQTADARVQIPRTTISKENGEQAVEINFNIQLPKTTPESASVKDLKEIRKIVKEQNLLIQNLQNKFDASEKQDSVRTLQIQLQNDEIQRLKNSLKNERENYQFLFDSNSKLWSALNNLEKRISSNDTIDPVMQKEKTHEIETPKEITIKDIEHYLTANPDRAKYVEEIAKSTQNRKYIMELIDRRNRKESMLEYDENEYEKEIYRKKKEENRKNSKTVEKENVRGIKEKNVENWVTSTIDEKYGMKLANTVIFKNENRRPDVQNYPRPKFVLKPRRRLTPTNSTISLSSCGSEFECSTFIDNPDNSNYSINVTQQFDQFSNSWTDDEILSKCIYSFPALKTKAPRKSILKNAEIYNDSLLGKNHPAKHSTKVTEQPDLFDDSLTDIESRAQNFSSISPSKNDKAEVSLLRCAQMFSSSIISENNLF